jgi:hypothetical protein
MVTTTVDKNELHLYKGSLFVGKYYKCEKTKEWKATSTIPMLTQRLNDALHEKPGASIKHKVKDPYTRTISDASRVRCLTWLVDLLVNSGEFQLGVQFKGYSLKKTNGCPYMAGITMFHGRTPVLTISDGWSDPTSRVIAHVKDNHIVGCMVGWLLGEHTGTFLDHIMFDSRMESYMMVDRALTLPFAALQTLAMNKNMSVNTSHDNAVWKNHVLTKHNLPTDNRWRSSVRHTMLIHKSKFSTRVLGTFYTVATFQYTRKFSTWSSEDVWIDVFNSALSTIKPLMRKKRSIGAFGMYMSPEEHMEGSTTVGKFLKQQRINLDMQQRDSVKLQVNVASNGASLSEQYLMSGKNMSDYLTHSAVCVTTPKHELVDSYLLTKFGVQGEGTIVNYLGINPHLNPVSNRHYIAVIEPKNLVIEPMWLASLESAKTWYSEYELRMQQNVINKAKQIQANIQRLSPDQQREAQQELEKLSERSTNALNIVDVGSAADVTILGAACMVLSIDTIIQLGSNSKQLILTVPAVVEDSTKWDCLMPEMTLPLNNSIKCSQSRIHSTQRCLLHIQCN